MAAPPIPHLHEAARDAPVAGSPTGGQSTIDAPSDLALDFVFTGGAIGNHTASNPEIPFPPEPDDTRLCGAGSSSERRVTHGSSGSTTHTNATVVQRALHSAARAAELALDPVPGAGPVPLWRPRGSTGLFDGLPGERISSSATFVA